MRFGGMRTRPALGLALLRSIVAGETSAGAPAVA